MKRLVGVFIAGLFILGGTGVGWAATCSNTIAQPKDFVAEVLFPGDLDAGLLTNTNAHNDCFHPTDGHKHNESDSAKIDAVNAIIDKLQMDEVSAPTSGSNHGFFYVKEVEGKRHLYWHDPNSTNGS